MKLKNCDCGKEVTTKNALKNKNRRGELDGSFHLVFTCPKCFSSFYIFDKAGQKMMALIRAKKEVA